jgi:xanthine dehydrogenase molybdopterin-binding subunit B
MLLPRCNDVQPHVLQILRADIVMDLGKSINPTIDIGQVHMHVTFGCWWAWAQ